MLLRNIGRGTPEASRSAFQQPRRFFRRPSSSASKLNFLSPVVAETYSWKLEGQLHTSEVYVWRSARAIDTRATQVRLVPGRRRDRTESLGSPPLCKGGAGVVAKRRMIRLFTAAQTYPLNSEVCEGEGLVPEAIQHRLVVKILVRS